MPHKGIKGFGVHLQVLDNLNFQELEQKYAEQLTQIEYLYASIPSGGKHKTYKTEVGWLWMYTLILHFQKHRAISRPSTEPRILFTSFNKLSLKMRESNYVQADTA